MYIKKVSPSDIPNNPHDFHYEIYNDDGTDWESDDYESEVTAYAYELQESLNETLEKDYIY